MKRVIEIVGQVIFASVIVIGTVVSVAHIASETGVINAVQAMVSSLTE